MDLFPNENDKEKKIFVCAVNMGQNWKPKNLVNALEWGPFFGIV